MLQFITDGASPVEIIEQTAESIAGGCRWVQIRMKDAADDEVTHVARSVMPLCRATQTTLILDDRVHLVGPTGAHGVHLGKEDMPPDEARRLLGSEAIIGATANTFADIERLARLPIDYLGVGPFRFTTTKKRLAPVLGLEGYADIIARMREQGIELPVVAIGGITLPDVGALMQTGINGIAVSGAIARSTDPAEATYQFIKQINLNS